MRRPAPLDRRILALAWPALGSLVVEPLYELTDTAIVGHLGRVPLAGLALAATVLNLVGFLTNFLTMATTSRVAFRHGRGDAAGVAGAATAVLATAGGLGLLLALAVALAGPPAAGLLGGHGAVLAAAGSYLRISAAGLPFLLLGYAGTGLLQGLADTRTPLRIVLVANVVNVVLELVLVYGAGAGLAGSAWGTVAAQVVAAGLFLLVAARRLGRLGRPRPAELRHLLGDGLPLVVRTLALGAALTASTALAARLGPARLAAHQIVLQVWLTLALVLDALALPAQVFVSGALGAGRREEAVAVGARCLRIGWVAGGLLAAGTAAGAGVLPAVFTGDRGVRGAAVVALLACAVQQPLAAAAFVLDGLLLGAGDYRALRQAMLLALAIFALPALAVALDHRLGLLGIWVALGCWLAARAAILGRRWASGAWAPPDPAAHPGPAGQPASAAHPGADPPGSAAQPGGRAAGPSRG